MRFENLTCVHSHGLTLGSEMSGGIEDILFKNISVGQAFAAVRVKSARGRGGYIKDVVYEDIRAGSVLSGVWVDMDCTPRALNLTERGCELAPAKASEANSSGVGCAQTRWCPTAPPSPSAFPSSRISLSQVRRSMHQGCLLNPRNLVFYPFFTHFPPSFAHFQRLDARNPGSTARSSGANGKKSETIAENGGN